MHIIFLPLSTSHKGASLSLPGHSPATHTSNFFNSHCKPTFPFTANTLGLLSKSNSLPVLNVTFCAPACPPSVFHLSKCVTTCPAAQPETSDLVHLSLFTPCPGPIVAMLATSGPEYLPHWPTSRPSFHAWSTKLDPTSPLCP